jgi:hypothetical protein
MATDLVWRTMDERKVIPVNPSEPLDLSLFDKYDIRITGVAGIAQTYILEPMADRGTTL